MPRVAAADRTAVIDAARRRLLRGERIDMSSIADELGVGRATVYRWFGDRHQLSSEAWWTLAYDTLEWARRKPRPPGAEGLVQAVIDMLDASVAHSGMQSYVTDDPQRAANVIIRTDSVMARNYRKRLEELILEECPEAIGPDTTAGELALALARLSEAYCWSNILTGGEADADETRRLFLRVLM
ncbi:MAG: hypothetical protein QOH75_3719 [Actinomycetota bacterium]|nr:hypothetical protein [Actinomycetota bacterium]